MSKPEDTNAIEFEMPAHVKRIGTKGNNLHILIAVSPATETSHATLLHNEFERRFGENNPVLVESKGPEVLIDYAPHSRENPKHDLIQIAQTIKHANIANMDVERMLDSAEVLGFGDGPASAHVKAAHGSGRTAGGAAKIGGTQTRTVKGR